MNQARHLQAAGSLVGLLLIGFTILDWATLTWPAQPRSLEWRYSALSSLSGSLLTPSLGVLILFAVAYLGERQWLNRALSAFLLLVGLGLGAAGMLLALDVLQVRANVGPEMIVRYDASSFRSLAKLSIGSLASFLFALVALKATRASQKPVRSANAKQTRPSTAAPAPLLLRTAGGDQPNNGSL